LVGVKGFAIWDSLEFTVSAAEFPEVSENEEFSPVDSPVPTSSKTNSKTVRFIGTSG